MSYFKDMFRSVGTDMNIFVIHSNLVGEVVAYRVDEVGRIAEMRAGSARDVIGEPLQEADPWSFVATLGANDSWMRQGNAKPDAPHHWGFQSMYWHEVVSYLNAKNGSLHYKCLAIHNHCEFLGLPIDRYIDNHFNIDDNLWFRVTDYGKKYDAAAWERWDEKRRSNEGQS